MKPETTFAQAVALIVAGVLLSLALLETGLRLAGGFLLFLQDASNNAALKHRGSHVILCLGESTTALGGKDSYPSQLEQILNERSGGQKITVINQGIISTTTQAIAQSLDRNLNRYVPDIVITMMGINDYRPVYPYPMVKIHRLRVMKLMKYLYFSLGNFFRPTPDYYFRMGEKYRKEDKLDKAQESFKKIIAMDPHNDGAYDMLALAYGLNNDKALFMLNKCVGLNPGNDRCYENLGEVYMFQGQWDKAENAFRIALKLDPNENYCFNLASLYEKTGRLKEAVKVWDLLPNSKRGEVSYFALQRLYQKLGEARLAQSSAEKAGEMESKRGFARTYFNYRGIANEILKRKIRLICVQYPVRSVAPLKKMLDGLQGIVFVDNEKAFKEGVARHGYDYYFFDRFAGDFGHATHEGNRLLAENIANVILREVFKR